MKFLVLLRGLDSIDAVEVDYTQGWLYSTRVPPDCDFHYLNHKPAKTVYQW